MTEFGLNYAHVAFGELLEARITVALIKRFFYRTITGDTANLTSEI
jgi:hypothetical protein